MRWDNNGQFRDRLFRNILSLHSSFNPKVARIIIVTNWALYLAHERRFVVTLGGRVAIDF